MSKSDNNKMRNLAELINIIDKANKSGFLVNGLLYGDLFADNSKFDIRIVYKDKSINNDIVNYTNLIQQLFYASGNSVNKLTIISDAYIIHFKGVLAND